MLKWIKSIFSRKEKMNLINFTVDVEVTDAAGHKRVERRDSIQAPSEKILRIMQSNIGEPVVRIINASSGSEVKILGSDKSSNTEINKIIPDKNNDNIKQNQTNNTVPPIQINKEPQIKIKTQPKYYKIGDVDIKEQDGCLYQKQWMNLDINEVKNFRVVSDSTNKIIPLAGKHIEIRKWVRVSSSDEKSEHKSDENITTDNDTNKVLING